MGSEQQQQRALQYVNEILAANEPQRRAEYLAYDLVQESIFLGITGCFKEEEYETQMGKFEGGNQIYRSLKSEPRIDAFFGEFNTVGAVASGVLTAIESSGLPHEHLTDYDGFFIQRRLPATIDPKSQHVGLEFSAIADPAYLREYEYSKGDHTGIDNRLSAIKAFVIAPKQLGEKVLGEIERSPESFRLVFRALLGEGMKEVGFYPAQGLEIFTLPAGIVAKIKGRVLPVRSQY